MVTVPLFTRMVPPTVREMVITLFWSSPVTNNVPPASAAVTESITRLGSGSIIAAARPPRLSKLDLDFDFDIIISFLERVSVSIEYGRRNPIITECAVQPRARSRTRQWTPHARLPVRGEQTKVGN